MPSIRSTTPSASSLARASSSASTESTTQAVTSPTPHRFESADSTQTLAEGLAEYFASNPALKRDADLSTEARRFFESHDAVHVVYGCGTSMPDEAIVKLSSIFGTTGGVKILRGYLHYESLDIYRKLPLRSTLLAILTAPVLILRTIWRCARQRRRWPWQEFDEYASVSLREIRSQFGIKVAHRRRSDKESP